MELSLDESKVLIIYTGGTIGMLVGQQGYVPEPYFLMETFRSQARFHDPFQDSLFSNATSVEGFRQWSNNSGRSSPTIPPSTSHPHAAQHRPTLPVRSSRPIGVPTALKPSAQPPLIHQPLNTKISDDVYEAHLPALVTPRTIAPGGSAKRIRYAVLEVTRADHHIFFPISRSFLVGAAFGQQ